MIFVLPYVEMFCFNHIKNVISMYVLVHQSSKSQACIDYIHASDIPDRIEQKTANY